MLLEGLIERWGIPLALYSDRHAVFKHNARHANASRFSVAFYLRQSLPKSNVLIEAMRADSTLTWRGSTAYAVSDPRPPRNFRT